MVRAVAAWLKDLLHGTSIGHPLHPALTDIPVGAWSMTALFDACEVAGYDAVRSEPPISASGPAFSAVWPPRSPATPSGPIRTANRGRSAWRTRF